VTHLTYQGDVSEQVIGQIMGPDIYGGLSEAVEAEYFPLADITRVKFAPIYIADDRSVSLDEFGQLRVVSDG
jgi:hypothetical protein